MSLLWEDGGYEEINKLDKEKEVKAKLIDEIGFVTQHAVVTYDCLAVNSDIKTNFDDSWILDSGNSYHMVWVGTSAIEGHKIIIMTDINHKIVGERNNHVKDVWWCGAQIVKDVKHLLDFPTWRWISST